MAATKILITDGMAKNGLSLLEGESSFNVEVRDGTPKEELLKIIGNYDCIVIRSATTLTPELINAASQMKLIVRAGAGLDNVDVETATSKKIPVMNTASANALAAAEQTIALMFSMLRLIPQAAQSMHEGKWDRKTFKGVEATGKTIGIIGLGSIGKLVSEKAIGLGMKVIAFDPVSPRPSDAIHLVTTIDEIFEKSDIVTFHVPKTKDTLNLASSERISKMKKGSFLINCARGGIVEEKAVLEALDSGQLAGAAFDVYEKEPPELPSPLVEHPRTVCVPHLGATTVEAQARVASTAAEQILGFFKKGESRGVVNL